uniref:PI3K/PI4K catalytic domain-containing protein n=1 Tax=Noctiluca scintillans TaxID=2966 RepID=A0A7S1A194_NOCSC|mmetsp:Transcript_27700/g.73090  ORF Transcript_27700/g.73090 Transcript_27700/m.73090 type:complete len:594 (+) Transcript_27700:31-1812(+)
MSGDAVSDIPARKSPGEPPDESDEEMVDSNIDGLDDWIQELGFGGYITAAKAWCDQEGAAFLEEVVDHAEFLAVFLGLEGEDREHMVEGAWPTFHLVRPDTFPHHGSILEAVSESEADAAQPLLRRPTLRVLSDGCQGGETPSGEDGPESFKLLNLPYTPDTAKNINRVLTVTAEVQQQRHWTEVEGSPIQREATTGSTATCTIHGPLSSMIGALPIKVKRGLSTCWVTPISEMSGEGADYYEKTRRGRVGRVDTLGDMNSLPSRRNLVDRITSDKDLKPVNLDAGQTGQVYVLEAGSEKIAVFKPLAGENFKRKGIDQGMGAIREEAAYLVDRITGSQACVPVTSRAEVEVNGRVTAGSVQAFIGNVAGFIEDFAMPRPLDRACEFIAQETAEALALLDMRLFNLDRHSGNLLLLKRCKPHTLGPIDHGCCLPPWWILSEAVFDAWQSWPQLQAPPTPASRFLCRTAAKKLNSIADALRDIGLDESSILTHRLCTMFVSVGVELGIPVGCLAALMLRDGDKCFAELSWLERRVFECARSAGAKICIQKEIEGEEALAVENGGCDCEAERFLELFVERLRTDLPSEISTGCDK